MIGSIVRFVLFRVFGARVLLLLTILGWIFLSLIVVIWMAKPPFAAKAGAAGGGH